MNIAAYCRVSTDKADQLNSLEAQKEFFTEYTKRTGDTLVRLYADEGISGTKIKNRKEFLRMMADAERGFFDLVVVKDISRFARNTVDLLQNVRKLKSLGIETVFLTANMTSMGNSEFVLTIFGALAQEESANTSKRVKFGKKMNAEKGRVPNLVYGYDKMIGDYFNLEINQEEAEVIRQIFKWYINEGYGAARISIFLNERGLKTKRNCQWSQNAVCRILTNELSFCMLRSYKPHIPSLAHRYHQHAYRNLLTDLFLCKTQVFRLDQHLEFRLIQNIFHLFQLPLIKVEQLVPSEGIAHLSFFVYLGNRILQLL